MERDIVLSGIKLGEHSFNPENMMEEIRIRAVEAGKKFETSYTIRFGA